MDNVLDVAVAHAAEYLETAPSRPVAATATVGDLRRRLGKPLPETGTDAEEILHDLVRDVEGVSSDPPPAGSSGG